MRKISRTCWAVSSSSAAISSGRGSRPKTARADLDTDAKFRIGNTAAGLTGITVDVPQTAARNYATATDEKTTLLTAGELFYDVQLEEPSGRKTTLTRGKLLVVGDVTDA